MTGFIRWIKHRTSSILLSIYIHMNEFHFKMKKNLYPNEHVSMKTYTGVVAKQIWHDGKGVPVK